MASMNISIKGEAYTFLKSLKSKDRSFSDVILEFKAKDNDIMRFFGVLKEIDWDKRSDSRKDFRDSFKRRLG